jgi:hypothetical protein
VCLCVCEREVTISFCCHRVIVWRKVVISRVVMAIKWQFVLEFPVKPLITDNKVLLRFLHLASLSETRKIKTNCDPKSEVSLKLYRMGNVQILQSSKICSKFLG